MSLSLQDTAGTLLQQAKRDPRSIFKGSKVGLNILGFPFHRVFA